MEKEDATFHTNNVMVEDVTFSGSTGNYMFSVQLRSPDTGCDQYADWWEVIDTAGTLIYRRNLGHSHVNEQPFERSGGPIVVGEETDLIIRGHMNNLGYASKVMMGSIANGFVQDSLPSSFAGSLATVEPLPPKCAF